MATTWWLSSSESATDVKELIPEFFYFPEFLTNSESNKYIIIIIILYDFNVLLFKYVLLKLVGYFYGLLIFIFLSSSLLRV